MKSIEQNPQMINPCQEVCFVVVGSSGGRPPSSPDWQRHALKMHSPDPDHVPPMTKWIERAVAWRGPLCLAGLAAKNSPWLDNLGVVHGRNALEEHFLLRRLLFQNTLMYSMWPTGILRTLTFAFTQTCCRFSGNRLGFRE